MRWVWLLALFACVAVLVRAARVPADALRARRVVTSSAGACAELVDGTFRCWGASPYVDHREARPWARPAPMQAPSVHSGEDFLATACAVHPRGVVCPRGRPQLDADGRTPLELPELTSDPGLREIHGVVQAGPYVCLLARASDEKVSAFCHRRRPVPSGSVAVVDTDWHRVPFDAPRSLALGGDRLCARSRGPVQCVDLPRPEPYEIAGTEGADALVAGDDFACVRVEGRVACFGRNDLGQLGDGTFTDHADARPIALAGRITDVAAFGRRACALRDGVPYCWGELRPEQSLPRTTSAVPVVAADLHDLSAIGVASWFACGVRADETVWCWGRGSDGQLGDGLEMPRLGCRREGITGTSPELERLSASTVVRTGAAGAHLRLREVLWLVLAVSVLGPLALAWSAQRLGPGEAWLAWIFAAYVPLFVGRALQIVLAWLHRCGAWEYDLDPGILWTPLAPAAVFLLGSLVAVGLAIRTPLATRPRWVTAHLLGASLFLLLSMAFNARLVEQNVTELAYRLRDRRLLDTVWPFQVVWIGSLLWLAVTVTFVVRWRLSGRASVDERADR